MKKIENKRATISVVGLGYVGLPLAVAFAKAGFRVIGIDTDKKKVDNLNQGHSYIPDVPSSELSLIAKGPGSLKATNDYDMLKEVDAVIVCVPTPLGKTKDPDLSYIVAVSDQIALRVHKGMAVILESTTYPGTTEEIVLPRLSTGSNGMQVGIDFYLAFSPERIDPGRKDWTVKTTPKVMGGITPKCLEVACKLYSSAIDTVVPVSSARVAEMVKLLENTFRATNIALVNEFAIMCGRLGVDVWEVIEAAKTKPFGFTPFYPGPGIGGHCLPIDPAYLAWKLRTLNYNARFIHLAEEINREMPQYVLMKITDALNDLGKAVKGSRVLVLGVAYKPNVEDTRESPAIDLIDLLRNKGAIVEYNDPYVATLRADGWSMDSTKLDDSTLKGMDCVVIVTPHNKYDWHFVVENARLVVDTRNATKGISASPGRVVKL